TSSDNAKFEPRVSLSEVNGLSDTDVVNRLFILYLDHFKEKSIFNGEKIVAYKDVKARKVPHVNGYGDLYSVSYSVQETFWGSYWEAGNGHIAEDSWILGKSFVVELTKENGEAKLRIIGTGL
ncbi:Hypothetical protein LUCI_4467, partial [Lucifera butyrica]